MKRYEAVMGKYAGLPYVETNECSDGRFVLYSEAQAENAELLATLQYVVNTCPPIDWVGQDAVALAQLLIDRAGK